MPRHEEQKTLAYTADERFLVVANVKDYPSLVPWCSGVRIHREDPQEIIAHLEIGFGPFQESFTSQVTLDRPRQVLVRATEGGTLEHLTNTWTFTPVGDGTQVDLVVDFQFKSHLLDHVANNMFHEAAIRMMGAFESRMHLVHLMTQRHRQHPSSVRAVLGQQACHGEPPMPLAAPATPARQCAGPRRPM
jgi:coenzyme Q-binding protein COQ10